MPKPKRIKKPQSKGTSPSKKRLKKLKRMSKIKAATELPKVMGKIKKTREEIGKFTEYLKADWPAMHHTSAEEWDEIVESHHRAERRRAELEEKLTSLQQERTKLRKILF